MEAESGSKEAQSQKAKIKQKARVPPRGNERSLPAQGGRSAQLPPGKPRGAPGRGPGMYTRGGRGSEGGALRLLLRVPLLCHRVSPRVLQGAQAERRPELYVDGGDVKVDEICRAAEREAAESGGWGQEVVVTGPPGRPRQPAAPWGWGWAAPLPPRERARPEHPNRVGPGTLEEERGHSSRATASAHPPAPFPVGRQLRTGEPTEDTQGVAARSASGRWGSTVGPEPRIGRCHPLLGLPRFGPH